MLTVCAALVVPPERHCSPVYDKDVKESNPPVSLRKAAPQASAPLPPEPTEPRARSVLPVVPKL